MYQTRRIELRYLPRGDSEAGRERTVSCHPRLWNWGAGGGDSGDKAAGPMGFYGDMLGPWSRGTLKAGTGGWLRMALLGPGTEVVIHSYAPR